MSKSTTNKLDFVPTKLLYSTLALIAIKERKTLKRIEHLLLRVVLQAALTEARLLAFEPATTDVSGPFRGSQKIYLSSIQYEFLMQYAEAVRIEPMILARKLVWLGVDFYRFLGCPRLQTKEDFVTRVRCFLAQHFYRKRKTVRPGRFRLAC